MTVDTQTPLVTVYITNYNYGKYIRKAVHSVLNQSKSIFEIIIIDDGSTDNSREIIEQFEDHSNIDIIFQHNKGLNVTNNIALRVARGKYIMRLDADDFLAPEALEIMTLRLEEDDELGLIFPDYYLVDDEDNILSIERRHDFKNNVSLYDQPAHGAVTLIRKSYLLKLGGYDEEFSCQDGYELWVKFVAKFKVGNVNKPLFYYRQHGSNLTTNENRILETRAKIKKKFVSITKKRKGTTIAIVPVRGQKYNSKSVAFKELGEQSLLDIKLIELLKTNDIELIVVSSPDHDIKDFVELNYSENNKVYFHMRDEKLARLNTGLVDTVASILSIERINRLDPEILLVSSIEYPFVNSHTFEDALNTLAIFESDSLITVRAETSMFLQHHGHGMEAILGMEKFTRIEREALYRYSGGVIVVRTSEFSKNKALITGKVGHIEIDQKTAHSIKSEYDYNLAQFLHKQAEP
jgi:glycosyltransferase involved in cell wall biosynthesis